MRLYHTHSSPFVRKVMVAAHELGLTDRIETVNLRPSPLEANAELSAVNPLNKIPALILDDGEILYDSAVICEYLDTLVPEPSRLVPSSGPARFRTLRTQALCDGILEAGVAVFYEKIHRPAELQFAPWMKGQSQKALQGLDTLSKESESWPATPDLGQICAAVTLGWLEFRNPLGDVRTSRPPLAHWYERFLARPSMQATLPHA